MFSPDDDGRRCPGIEVVRDGHVIYTYGYGGLGPCLACIEALDGDLEGTTVRMEYVSDPVAKLLVLAGVADVDVDRITHGASLTLFAGNVNIRAGRVVSRGEDPYEHLLDGVDDPADVMELLRSSSRLWRPAWNA